ncbi:PulJ/GspJ family protein [Novipirellula artificiosorum]|uniref:Pseudopilin GspJ n=1 Tax=Novipirellula artificiosorum TaxID=2528016 RepID=A0A5C6D707_9BACT|nr:hypothetical protein [Novipirellula artificiosorum]TWU32983.1 hypothetical protein Poly41_53620 [Novipirellula artificiosorum]
MTTKACLGHTLIEMVVSMSVGTSLMVLAVGLVHQSMRIKSISDERSDQNRTTQRLIQHFRDDVHHARSIETVANGMKIITPDEQQITYLVETEQVDRMETRPDGRVRRESYLLAKSFAAAFAVTSDQQQAEVVIQCVFENEKPRIDRRGIANVGRLADRMTPAEKPR